MVLLRSALSRVLLACVVAMPAAAVLVPSDAAASVSIAVAFETLVKDADDVVVVTPGDHSSVWEDGRIYTYTKVHVDQGVAGSLGPGADGWVRTMGGVVGKIGQLVDGEPVFVKDQPSLLFMRKFKDGGVFEVAARAQGQYAVTIDAATKQRRLVRSSAAGMLLPPRKMIGPPVADSVKVQSQGSTVKQSLEGPKLAQDVMHDKPLEEMTREIALNWKRLHPVPAVIK
jgi:hypothetical protein